MKAQMVTSSVLPRADRAFSQAIFFASLLVASCWAVLSLAQDSGGVYLPSNRQDARGVQQAKELIARGEFSQAIRYLDEVLARPEDSFVAVNQDEFAGLKSIAGQLLRELPSEGQSMYEATFGPVAKRLLDDAVQSGDVALLREVYQRYFYTPAGHEAALLFAGQEADRGRHLTAALIYEQLLETPGAAKRFQPQLSLLAAVSWMACQQPERALQYSQTPLASGYSEAELAGESRPLRGLLKRDEFQVWGQRKEANLPFEQAWLTSRGNVARNGSPEGGLPHLRVRWQVRMLANKNLESVHEEMEGVLSRQQKYRLPTASPIAVGNYIITRSAHGLVAIDFRTGKRVWQAQPQRELFLQELVDSSSWQEDNEDGAQAAESFARMVWEDYLYNAISSDGERVFVIRDLSVPKSQQRNIFPFMPAGKEDYAGDDTNRLCAYELATQGKLVWEIDGAARTDDLQGVFFLGAPIHVGQMLYCLAEIKSETAVYLLALDRQTGGFQWKQRLADLEQGIALDPKRRLQGALPAYQAGMLICPTGSGVVVAVDLAKRALSWAYSYPTIPNPILQLRNRRNQLLQAEGQWLQSVPVISEGRVLLTPPESKWLHCLDLRSGKTLWKKPRGDAWFLAGVFDQRVLLVGEDHLSALKLSDGEPAWSEKSVSLPENTSPSGSGFLSEGKYYLPLSNAEVVAYDLADGQLVARTKSREDQQLGNMICYRGSVISQTGKYLDCFDQVEVLRARSQAQLAQDPNNADALRTLGEIAYNEGDIRKAIQQLSAAFESDTDNLRTREVLGEALVAALDENFSDYQQYLPLLDRIQPATPEAQLTQLRLQVQGSLQLGKAVDAFQHCLAAFQQLETQDFELSVGSGYHVQARRWLAGQVQTVWDIASLDEQSLIEDQANPLLLHALESGDLAIARTHYDCFSALQSFDSLGLELGQRYLEQGEMLAAQQLFLALTRAQNSEVRGASIARCSQILHESNLPRLAVEFDRQLAGPLASVPCLEGKTGLECLLSWRESTAAGPKGLPYGRVEISMEEQAGNPNSRSRVRRTPYVALNLERTDDVLGDCNLIQMGVSTGRSRELRIQDGLGREFYRTKLDQGNRSSLRVGGSEFGVSLGNLLIVSLGRQILALDTLSPEREALWRKNTSSSLQYTQQPNLRRTIAGRRVTRAQNNGYVIGNLGPVTADSCIFQIENKLVCVDSLSGEPCWQREGIPPGADLFGNEQCVLVVPPDSNQANVFSTIDGRMLNETPIELPDWEQQLATVGHTIVRWSKQNSNHWTLSAFDPLEQQVLWSHQFERDAYLDAAENRFAAVAEASGRCTVVDLRSGEKVVDQPIKENVALQAVHLLVGTDRFVIAAEQPFAGPRQFIKELNRYDYTSSPFAAQLYLFDRNSGESLWQSPAEVSGLPLMLSQPADLPIISFVGTIVRQDRQGSKQELGLLLLEKATGRVLYENQSLPRSRYAVFFRSSQENPEEIIVDMLDRQLHLTFTDKPRPPEPPMVHHVQRSSGTSSKGLQNLLEKMFGGNSSSPKRDQ